MKDNRKTKLVIILISILLLVLSIIVMVLVKKENAASLVSNSSDNTVVDNTVISDAVISDILKLYNKNNSNMTNVHNYIDFVPIGVYTDENNIEIKAKGSAAFEINDNDVKRLEAICDHINVVAEFGVPNETIDIFEVKLGGDLGTVNRPVDIKNIHTIFSDGKIKAYDGYNIGKVKTYKGYWIGDLEHISEGYNRYEIKYPAVQNYAVQIIELLNTYNSTEEVDDKQTYNISVDIVKNESQKINGKSINVQCIKLESPDENYLRSGKINIYYNKNNEILMIEYNNCLILGIESIKIPKANVECEKDEERIVPGYPKESYK